MGPSGSRAMRQQRPSHPNLIDTNDVGRTAHTHFCSSSLDQETSRCVTLHQSILLPQQAKEKESKRTARQELASLSDLKRHGSHYNVRWAWSAFGEKDGLREQTPLIGPAFERNLGRSAVRA